MSVRQQGSISESYGGLIPNGGCLVDERSRVKGVATLSCNSSGAFRASTALGGYTGLELDFIEIQPLMCVAHDFPVRNPAANADDHGEPRLINNLDGSINENCYQSKVFLGEAFLLRGNLFPCPEIRNASAGRMEEGRCYRSPPSESPSSFPRGDGYERSGREALQKFRALAWTAKGLGVPNGMNGQGPWRLGGNPLQSPSSGSWLWM